jgi:hypothetical protein
MGIIGSKYQDVTKYFQSIPKYYQEQAKLKGEKMLELRIQSCTRVIKRLQPFALKIMDKHNFEDLKNAFWRLFFKIIHNPYFNFVYRRRRLIGGLFIVWALYRGSKLLVCS